MAKREIDVKVKAELTGINKIRSELKEVKNELTDALTMDDVDPAKIETLTQRAGELKDQLSDVNEQVNIFATGSKYESVSKSLGSIGGALKNLDFNKATQRANLFAAAAGKITFKDAISSVKDLGKTFFTVGKALLTNPLFLIGAVIALVAVKVYELLDSLGMMEDVIKMLTLPLTILTEGLKELTNWFAKGAIAAKEAAEEKAKAYEDAAKEQTMASNEIIRGIDNEIRMAKLLGKDTTDLEREKLLEIRKTALARAEADQAAFEAGLKNKKLTEEEIEKLREKAIMSRIAAQQSYDDIVYFDAKIEKDKEDAKDKDDEDAKKQAEKDKQDRKKAYEERIKKEKEFQANRLKAVRDIQNIENDLLEEGVEKDVKINNDKYKRLIEDTLSNEKLLQSEKDKLKKLLEDQQKVAEEKIREEARKKREEEEKAAVKSLNDLMLSLDENRFRAEIQMIENETEEKLKLLREQQEKGLISKEELDAAEIALEENKQKRLRELSSGGDMGLSKVDKARKEALELINIEKQRLDAGLIDEMEYAKRVEQINKDLNKTLLEEDRKLRDEKISYINAGLDAAVGAFSSIAALSQATNEVQIANAEGNEQKQEMLRKKGFEQNKKMQIAQATMSGIQGVINALTAATTVPEPLGSILKGVQAGIVATATTANIAKIKATRYEGGSSSVTSDSGGNAAGNGGRTMPNISFGSFGNNQNSVGAGGGSSDTNIMVSAVVSETEITSVQNKNANRIKNAEL
jgi:DNA repair exonuclease SbcCD ATPase subunit